ncbi:MAG: HAMP domain-containing sensor histidine kinase, partial [Myxococcota bacterium]
MQLRLPQQVLRERQLAEGQHARSLEELSAGIAHEIRNPITAAKSLVQQIGEDPSDPENAEYARVAIQELDRVERSIAHLLRYAREEPVKTESTSMQDIIESAMDTFKDRLTRQDVKVDQQVNGDTRITGDPDKLRRVVINLVNNALDALEEIPDAKLTIASGQNLAGTEVWLQVKDNGMGMSKDKVAKIFAPFHTSKSTGTGLGLPITRKLIDKHGGRIEVNSEESVGTTFIVTLPRSLSIEERV